MQAGHPLHVQPTFEEFIKDSSQWFQHGKRSDRDLLYNNQCFDLGMSPSNTTLVTEVTDLAKHMDDKFGMVSVLFPS